MKHTKTNSRKSISDSSIKGKIALLFFSLIFLSFSNIFATHFRYGIVTATKVSETSTTIVYKLNVSMSFRTDYPVAITSAPFTISGGNTGSINVPLTSVLDPSGGWINNTGSANLTLNKTSVLTKISHTGCCKISTLSNNADTRWDVFTIINTGASGNSPVSTLPAIINMPVGAASAVYTVPASDPDPGSTLTFGIPSFTGNLAGETEPVGFAINAATGQISMNTVGKVIGQLYNAMVTVTDNTGNQIILDFIIKIVGPSNPPVFDYSVTPSNGTVYNVIAGQNISFPLRATDSDVASTVSLSVSGLPAYITTSNFSSNALPATGNPSITNFSWTPAIAQIGSTVVLNVIATDNVGVQSSTSVTIKVVAEPAPVFISPTPIENSIRQIVTGTLLTDVVVAQSSLGSNVSIAFSTGIPAGASLSPGIPTAGANPGQTTLNWTPVSSDFGLHTLSFQAIISGLPTIFSTRNYLLVVNTPPAFSSSPITTAIVGQPYSYAVTVTDTDIPYGDVIDIIGSTIPSWLTLVSTGNGTATLSGTPTIADIGSNSVDLEAEDIYHHGNPDLIEQNFSINVVEPAPVAVCKNITVQLDNSGSVTITANDIDNGSYSLVGISSMAISQSNFNCSNVGANYVDLIVFNTYGNSDTCTATVTVEDKVAPIAICKSITVQLDATGNASIVAADVNDGSNDACGIASLAVDKSNFTCADVTPSVGSLSLPSTVVRGFAGRTVTFNNINVNGTGSNIVTVAPGSAVTVSTNWNSAYTSSYCPGCIQQYYIGVKNLAINCMYSGNTAGNRSGSGYLSFTAPTTPGVYVVQAESSLQYSCTGTAAGMSDSRTDALAFIVVAPQVTLTVTDVNGNVSTCKSSITIEDKVAPIAICKSITVQLDATGNTSIVAADVNDGSNDACGIASIAIDKSAFDCSNVGANTVTLTVTDVNGNVSTCTSTVTVEDKVAPIAICKSITVQLDATGNTSIVAADVNDGSNDACGIASIAIDKSAFDCSNVGANTVTLTVTDVNGNVSTCTSTVTVEDKVAPIAICKSITVQLDATGNVSITATTNINHLVAAAADDDDGGEDGGGDDDGGEEGGGEEGGGEEGGGEEGGGDEGGGDDGGEEGGGDEGGSDDGSGININNGSHDACGIASMTIDKSTFNCSNVGANTVTLTVTDVNGNVSTCQSIVTVEDHIAPVAICKSITVQLDATGNTSIVAADVNDGSNDACGIASLVIDKSTFDCSNVGANTVTLTVTDVNGNVSTCQSTVTVEDHIAPVAVCKSITVQLDATGNTSIVAADINDGSNDACGIASLVIDKSTFDCSNVGANTVTLTVTDVNGNVSTCQSTVTVQDNIAPVISCPANIFVQAERNDCSPIVNWENVVASDNCTYTVTSSHNSGDRFPVGTTTVTYTVVDASGNTATCTFEVTVTPDPLVATSISAITYIGGNNVSCKGKSDGEATVVVEGGCLPYSYLWSNGQTNATATGLAAGTYTVNITDANGTTISSVITLTEPAQLVVNAGNNQTVYYGYNPSACATLNGTATGGITAYSYVWSNGSTIASATVCPSVTTSYNLTVTDVNGCVANSSVTVCAINVRCEKGGNAIIKGQGDKVMICHKSGNNKTQTLCISADGVAAHLAHGDLLGECGVNTACFTPVGREALEEGIQTIEVSDNGMNVLAYPNPFNTTTTINFNTTQDERITIKVYNIEGSEVSNLFEGDVKAGDVREVIFNGNELSTGMYFVKVSTSSGKLIVNKLMLNK